jgi:hypothetical protein
VNGIVKEKVQIESGIARSAGRGAGQRRTTDETFVARIKICVSISQRLSGSHVLYVRLNLSSTDRNERKGGTENE